MGSNNEFDSEYCNVRYIEADKIVLITWKQFACFENYRKPTTFALELLKANSGSNMVVDARNGFEDETEDVEWGFSYLLPEMSKTDCNKVAFIMNAVNDIEEEMDMWTKEFGKYFAVFKADSYEKAISKMKTMIWLDVVYLIKEGKREEFYNKILELGVMDASRKEPGCFRYDYSAPMESENELWLTEIWTDSNAHELHSKTAHFQKLQELKKDFVLNFNLNRYTISID